MKRSSLLAAALVCCLSVAAHATCGDANEDGPINILDALATARHSSGVSLLPPSGRLLADVNDNGAVEITDALLIAQSSAGIAVSLTCPTGTTSGTWGTNPSTPPTPPAPTKLYALEGYSGNIVVVDIATGSTVGSVFTGSGVALAKDPTRDLLYVSSGASVVHVIDTTTDTLTGTFNVSGLSGTIEVSPDGTTLAGITSSGVVVVDLPARTVRHTVSTGSSTWGNGYLAITPDSSAVWRSDDLTNTAIKVDLVAGTVEASVAVGNGPYGIDTSPSGDMVFVINHFDQTLSRIDTATNLEVLPRQPVGVYPMAVLGHSTGTAFAVNCISGNVSEHDPVTGAQQGAYSVGQEPIDIAECGGGNVAVVNSYSNWLTIIDPATGTTRNINLGASPYDVAAK